MVVPPYWSVWSSIPHGMVKPSTQQRSAVDWEDAALAAIAEHGLASLAIPDLARTLGVTKGSFYWHFRGIQELVDAALGGDGSRSARRASPGSCSSREADRALRAVDGETPGARALRDAFRIVEPCGRRYAAPSLRRSPQVPHRRLSRPGPCRAGCPRAGAPRVCGLCRRGAPPPPARARSRVRQGRRDVRRARGPDADSAASPRYRFIMKKLLFALVLFVAATAHAQTLVLAGGRLIDGFGGPPLENAVVVIEGNRIKAVGAEGTIAIPSGARV